MSDQIETQTKDEIILRIDKEIEQLYDEVAAELSGHKEDAAFALQTLAEAHAIIVEEPGQYDEAIYRKSVVKTMLTRKRNLSRWSYTWGIFAFVYALVWLIGIIAALGFDDRFNAILGGSGEGVDAVGVAWFTALAGGLGGVTSLLYVLSWRIAYKHEFDRQYLMAYLVRPAMGLILGGVIFLIMQAGLLLFSYVSNQDGLFPPSAVALQMLFGWIVGFRQRVIYKMIDKILPFLSSEKVDEGE